MMKSESILKYMTFTYIFLFFAYLFLPLIFMSLVAFNKSTIPQVLPWQGFTLKWFGVLFKDSQMWTSLYNSFVVAFFVVIIAVPAGLSAALLLTRLNFKAKNVVYGLMVSPILVPGIVLGISTFLFWDSFLSMGGGIFTAVMGQSSFIATYCMLLTMSRLQRFDRDLEDAAFDLGADHFTVFKKITLPFLKPSLISAAGLAFMQSFENYNTTLFAIGIEQTLPIYIGTKLRVFISPAMNALAVIFIIVTIAGSVFFEMKKRKELQVL